MLELPSVDDASARANMLLAAKSGSVSIDGTTNTTTTTGTGTSTTTGTAETPTPILLAGDRRCVGGVHRVNGLCLLLADNSIVVTQPNRAFDCLKAQAVFGLAEGDLQPAYVEESLSKRKGRNRGEAVVPADPAGVVAAVVRGEVSVMLTLIHVISQLVHFS